MRSTSAGSMHRRELSATSSLPVIEEDRDSFGPPRVAPAVPPRAWNRPAHKVFGLGAPPRLNFDSTPPAYSQFDSTGVEGPKGEKLADVRKGITGNKHIAKRGGWARLCVIALIILLCLVGLIVGLVIGLRKHKSSSSTSGPSSTDSGSNSPPGGASGTVGGEPDNPASNITFPAGSYRIDTYLSTIATNCTSNSATWTCYPYSTYAEDRSGSAATYDWIISPVNGTNNYTISSTPNVFSLMFSNASMSLMNSGTSQEHYFFQISMQKPTKPAGQLSSENVASTCYFNETTFQAYLYTKMPKTYPNNSTDTNTTEPFAPWPYAVKVEQVAASGSGTPTCLDPSGNSVGDFSVSDAGQLCDCLYLNTGT